MRFDESVVDGAYRSAWTGVPPTSTRFQLIDRGSGSVAGQQSETDSEEPDHHEADQRKVYRALAVSSAALVAVATLLFSYLEGWSYVDSFYFSVVTASTVGYGDITPDTDAAKLFTVLYIVFGISLISAFLDARLKHHTARRARRHVRRSNDADHDASSDANDRE